MLVLDPTHPEAAEYMRGFIQQIVGWGYRLLKIDFLFAGTYPGPRYDGSTAMEGLRVVLRSFEKRPVKKRLLSV